MPSPSLVKLRWLRCFLLLSAADLLLTAHLLRGGVRFHEANPLAVWCLGRYGWLGLAAFKTATVLLAVGALVTLARRRPGAARLALTAACAAVGLVVLYSASLAAVVGPSLRRQEQRELEALAEEDRILDARCQKAHTYGRLLNRLSREVAAGRPLAEAVVELEALGRHNDSDWQRHMGRIYPGKTPREMLEAHLRWWAGLEGRRAALPKDRPPVPEAEGRSQEAALGLQ
jgi:predicted nucleic acid-binding protein